MPREINYLGWKCSQSETLLAMLDMGRSLSSMFCVLNISQNPRVKIKNHGALILRLPCWMLIA